MPHVSLWRLYIRCTPVSPVPFLYQGISSLITVSPGGEPNDSESLEWNSRPEIRFLVRILSHYFGASAPSGQTIQRPTGFDWDEFHSLTVAHGVFPLAFHVCSRLLPPGIIPPAVLARWKSQYEAHVAKSLALAGQLFSLISRFQSDGVLAVPVKGPILALSVYGELGMRTIRDLDFVFPKEQVLSARDILVSEGYVMQSARHWHSDASLLRSIYSEFTMSRDMVQVDVHWRILPSFFPFQLDSPSLWADCVQQTIAGRTVTVFSPEHQLLYLAAHGAKHYWARLQWLCDFAKFVQVIPVDWERAFLLCGEAGSIRVLSHALVLVHELLGIQLPERAVRHLDPVSRQVGRSLGRGILALNGEPPGSVEQFRFLVQIASDSRSILRLMFGMTLAPTEAEWRCLKLPPVAYPLYYPFRLARLAVKYALPKTFGR